MSFACPGITHCSNCHRALSMNEYGLCKDCEMEQKEEALKKELIESSITKETIKKDMKKLQNQIQEFVNKYNAPVNLVYDDNLRVGVYVSLSVKGE